MLYREKYIETRLLELDRRLDSKLQPRPASPVQQAPAQDAAPAAQSQAAEPASPGTPVAAAAVNERLADSSDEENAARLQSDDESGTDGAGRAAAAAGAKKAKAQGGTKGKVIEPAAIDAVLMGPQVRCKQLSVVM